VEEDTCCFSAGPSLPNFSLPRMENDGMENGFVIDSRGVRGWHSGCILVGFTSA
jgi:hypothetical protein